MGEIKNRYKEMNVSERYWWKVVALCFVGWILMYADRTILGPVMGNIEIEYGLTKTQLGAINSIFFLTYAIMQIPFGILGDRIGRKIVITFGFILFGAGTFLSGIATGVGIFMIYRAITGIGEAAYYGPQYALSAEAIPRKSLTLGTAIINSGMAFGTSGGYLLSSYLVLEKGNHWSLPFFIMSVPTIIVGILFIFLHEKVANKDLESKNVNIEVEEEKVSGLSVFKNKNLLFAFLLLFCSIYANFVIITWLPLFLQIERGFEGSSVGFIASLVPWASIPGALLFSRLSDKYKKTKIFVFTLIPLALISTFGMAFVTNRTLLIAMLILYGLTGKLALDPILVAYVTKNSPRKVLSTALSAYNFIGMSAAITAPYVTGWIADNFGSMQAGFYLASVLLFIGMVIFAFASEKNE
ncbi:MFS transporter [Oceanivirga salmonicida]|uniref:MFS transporter n=1 Tax=Oceanivirga salmonicida TaxID=1769291 RepID=UPI00083221E9|nr:MFS transporter [Oceanivirga salmonicida]